MPVSSFRRWLRRHPQPAKLRVDGRDVAIASGANQWQVTEESVLALSPSRVEALDALGVVLRATTLGERDDAGDDDASSRQKPVSEIAQLAQLISDAHDAGARRHAEAYALAFTENTKLVTLLATRLGGLETAWQKAMKIAAEANADAIAAAAEAAASAGGGDPAGAAVASMLASVLAKGASAPPAAKTNGTANGAPKGKA